MKYNNDVIFNMDETPLALNMPPNYTISRKGKKSVIILTQSQEKWWVSLVLGIIADGNKLPPLIIYKGSNKTKIPKELYNNKNIKEGKVFIAFNENAWCTRDIMMLWNEKILRKYMDKLEYLIPNLLLLDQTTMHQNYNVANQFENYDTELIFIPRGITRLLQPIDAINNKQ